MTREALIKHWNVIQAFKEGKQIQYNDSVPPTWQDTTDPQFKLAVEYRVKPEATKRLPTIEEAIAIRDKDNWIPQFGEMVMAYDEEADIIKDPHIFLFEKNGLYHCVSSGKKDMEEFNSSDYLDAYRVFKYKKISKIEEPKQIEISLEEAKEIIAKEKGISVEQVNLNFKIN